MPLVAAHTSLSAQKSAPSSRWRFGPAAASRRSTCSERSWSIRGPHKPWTTQARDAQCVGYIGEIASTWSTSPCSHEHQCFTSNRSCCAPCQQPGLFRSAPWSCTLAAVAGPAPRAAASALAALRRSPCARASVGTLHAGKTLVLLYVRQHSSAPEQPKLGQRINESGYGRHLAYRPGATADTASSGWR